MPSEFCVIYARSVLLGDKNCSVHLCSVQQNLNLKHHFGGKEIVFILTEEYLQFVTVLKFQQSVDLFTYRLRTAGLCT